MLKINGITRASKELTLAPDASEIVSFNIEAEGAPADYTVEFDEQSATFTVTARPTNWALIGIDVLVALKRKAALEG